MSRQMTRELPAGGNATDDQVDANNLRFRRLRLKNWKNLREVDVAVRDRMFLLGANGSGKSGVLRFTACGSCSRPFNLPNSCRKLFAIPMVPSAASIAVTAVALRKTLLGRRLTSASSS